MRRTSALLLLAVASACGGAESTGGIPTGSSTASVKLTVSSPDVMVSAGDTRSVTAVARDANQAVVATPNLTWSSSAPNVATVTGSATGATVTAVSDGSAIITAASGAVQDTLRVTVRRKVASVLVSGLPDIVAPGTELQVTAIPRDARQNAMTGGTVTYASNVPARVPVSNAGVVTALFPQPTAVITATLTLDGVTVSGSATTSVAFTSPQAVVDATPSLTFVQPVVKIAPGGKVTWAIGAVAHNVIFDAVAGAPGDIATVAIANVARTFPTAGTFTYHCSLHANMNGSVVVGGSDISDYGALLTGDDERPTPVATPGEGLAYFYLEGARVSYRIMWSGLTGPANNAHIHGPATAAQVGDVLVDFAPRQQTTNYGVLTGSFTAANIRGQGGRPPISFDSLVALIKNGNSYVNVHTVANPGGEIRGKMVGPLR